MILIIFFLSVKEYIDLFKKYHFSQMERVQLLNHLPKSEVELHLVCPFLLLRIPNLMRFQLLEECSSRLSEQQRSSFLSSLAAIPSKAPNA